MGPRDPRRAFEDDIREVLGDRALRGDRLIETIVSLGARHSLEPFRAFLCGTMHLDPPEPEAREMVVAIEQHRGALEGALGRDPGFTVAAFDRLHGMDRTLRDPVFRETNSPEKVAPSLDGLVESFEETLRVESRRAERSGRFLAIVVLSPDEPEAPGLGDPQAALAPLRDCARDVDTVAAAGLGELIILLPCTGGREGLRAADRFRRTLMVVTGAPFSAGVAAASGRAAEGRVLCLQARQALGQARRSGSGVFLYRAERRDHARMAVGDALPARLRSAAGVESDIVVEDLSLGGALVVTQRRMDPGGDVVLAVRGVLARPPVFLIPSRVLRVQDGPTPGRAPWRAAVGFGDEARHRVAALLAGLRSSERRAP